MSQEDDNRLIAGVRGDHWHIPIETGNMTRIGKEFICEECRQTVTVVSLRDAILVHNNPSYFTAEGQQDLLKWCVEEWGDWEYLLREWITELRCYRKLSKYKDTKTEFAIPTFFLLPTGTLAAKVAEYIRGKDSNKVSS